LVSGSSPDRGAMWDKEMRKRLFLLLGLLGRRIKIRNSVINSVINLLKKMPRRKLEDNNIRKLTKSGNGSIGLTLPIETVRDLGWREKQKVVVKRVRGGVLVKDWKK